LRAGTHIFLKLLRYGKEEMPESRGVSEVCVTLLAVLADAGAK
jgi:hypothetical protein